MSPLRSSAGPAIWRMPTPSSRRTICASEVLPRPGGPASRTWSSASPRACAASSATASCSFTRSWPTKSASDCGRSERSNSSSRLVASIGRDEARLAHAACLQRRAHLLLDRQLLVDVRERALGVDERPAELDERVAGEQRAAAGGARDEPVRRRSSPSARARRAARSCGRCPGSPRSGRCPRARSRGAAPRASTRRRSRARPSARRPDTPSSSSNSCALVGRGEAVELERVLADVEVRLDGRLLARRARSPAASPRRGSRHRRRRRRCPPPVRAATVPRRRAIMPAPNRTDRRRMTPAGR